MRNYEVAFIAHPEVNEQALAALTQKVQGWITAGGGTIARTDHWGKRRLAYPVRKQREGHYVFLYANMPPALGSELERQFRITEEIIRFLIVLGEPPASAVPVAGAAEPATSAQSIVEKAVGKEADDSLEDGR